MSPSAGARRQTTTPMSTSIIPWWGAPAAPASSRSAIAGSPLSMPPGYLMFSHLERLGYMEALRAAGIGLDQALCVEAAMTEDGGADAARRLLQLPDPPTAILCGHDLVAIGVLRGIAETGRVPGRDVRGDRRR